MFLIIAWFSWNGLFGFSGQGPGAGLPDVPKVMVDQRVETLGGWGGGKKKPIQNSLESPPTLSKNRQQAGELFGQP